MRDLRWPRTRAGALRRSRETDRPGARTNIQRATATLPSRRPHRPSRAAAAVSRAPRFRCVGELQREQQRNLGQPQEDVVTRVRPIRDPRQPRDAARRGRHRASPFSRARAPPAPARRTARARSRRSRSPADRAPPIRWPTTGFRRSRWRACPATPSTSTFDDRNDRDEMPGAAVQVTTERADERQRQRHDQRCAAAASTAAAPPTRSAARHASIAGGRH